MIRYDACMLISIEGIFRNDQIEFLEPPPQESDSCVVVTLIPARISVDLKERGIDEAQAARLRGRLNTIAQDRQCHEMDVYDELKP